MVNYVLSFCKITGASRIFSRNFYLPLLKPLTPKEALRTFRITGKWLLGAKIQHYMPVLLNHKKKRSNRTKDFGKKSHDEMDDYTYMAPVLDPENESHKLLLTILESKKTNGVFVYSVHDKKYNIVLQAQLEKAILDGDVIDVLVSQKSDKIIVKLKTMKKIPLEIQYYEGIERMFCGEGATSPEDEKFHHHGKYTMSLAKIFEDKEMIEEKWEEELKRIMRRRKRQAKEGSKEWKEMMKESIKHLDWKKFEEDARKIIDEIDEPALEEGLDMEIDDLETTKNVNETILNNSQLLDQLPTMKEIPDIIKSMGNATLHDFEEAEEEIDGVKRRVSGVKVTLSSGKECFVSGQMVHTEDGDVFVPGQTVENENGLEYAPGITINIDNKPTLISGLIMGEEEQNPMFLPTQSTITADGQLTFAASPEERPPPNPEKQKLKKQRLEEPELVEEVEEEISITETTESDDKSSVELNNSEIEELDIEAMRLKQEEQRLELERLKSILMDDGLDDVIASIESKRAQLHQKLEELRKLSVASGNSLVSYVSEGDTIAAATRISSDKDTINRLSDILMTMTRRAATLRDRNSINADNIDQNCIPVSNATEADARFSHCSPKLKMLLKTALVAANDAFKNRPKDQTLALNSILEIAEDALKQDPTLVQDLLLLMNTAKERNDVPHAIFKQLSQNITDSKVSALNFITNGGDPVELVDKILKKESETQSEAFLKILKLDQKLTPLLISAINQELRSINTLENEEKAVEILISSIEASITSLMKNNLLELLKNKTNHQNLKNDAISFAKALGMENSIDKLEETSDLGRVIDKSTVELLERVTLMRQLAERDYSLKSAFERIRKNPERGRNDPRIRQLVRESALLMGRGPLLRTSRDIPLNLLKTQNLLALEDCMMRRGRIDLPVLVTRNSLQAVVPKEAARGVLAGRVAYALVDESGVTTFKPMHMFSAVSLNKNREKRIDDYLNGVEPKDDRNFQQAKSNVRKLKRLLSNSGRQVA